MYLKTLRAEDIEVVILRLANVYGAGDQGRVIPIFVANALQNQPLIVYGGGQVLDLIWIGDVVETLIKAGFSAEPVLEPTNVGSGTTTTIHELAGRILRLVRSGAGVPVVPPRGPEVERFQADLTRANRVFGLQPQADPLRHLSVVFSPPGMPG